MAALGSIGIYRPFNIFQPRAWWLSSDVMPLQDMTGFISGTVMEEGTAVGNSLVQLFHKDTGVCLGRTFSASDGSFMFDNLSADEVGAYFVVAHDVPGGTNYKAVILDQLTAAT